MRVDTFAKKTETMADDEIKALFKRYFGTVEGQQVLMIILVKMGGLAELRVKLQGDQRAYCDGKRDAALQIMHYADFSPFDLALRLIELPALSKLKDLEHETIDDDEHGSARTGRRGGRGRRSGGRRREAVRAGDIAATDGFAGD